MKKRLLSALLALCMMLTMAPVAFAANKGEAADNPFTSVEEYNDAVTQNAEDWNGRDIYLTIAGTLDEPVEIKEGGFGLTNVQNRANPPKLHLTLEYCNFTGNTSGESEENGHPSFMYLSNCQELVIDNCTFDPAGAELTYGINWNLVQIEDATVSITNSTFKGSYKENAIKLNQRGAEDDTALDIIPTEGEEYQFAANIKEATISDCTFENRAIILLGSAGKNNGDAAPSTGAFPVTIKAAEGNYANVFLAYLASNDDADSAMENPSYALENGLAVALVDGETALKTANGDFAREADFVAEVNGDKYISLDNAIAAAEEDETVTLLKDVELTDGVNVDKKITLELNGYTITDSENWEPSESVDYLVAVKRGGDLTIEDSSENKSGQIAVTDTKPENIYCAVKLTIKGEDEDGELASLTVNGGTLIGNQYGICGNGTRHNTTLTINGGTIESRATYDAENNIDSIAIYQPQDGTLIITGGIIKSNNTAIEIRSGSLTVNEGAVIEGGTGVPKLNPNGNGGTTTNTGIAIAQHTTAKAIDVNITGGTITGGAAVYESNPQEKDGQSPVTVNVKKAELNGDVKSSGFGGITMDDVKIDGNVEKTGETGSMAILNSTIIGGTVEGNVTLYGCIDGEGSEIKNNLGEGTVATYNGKEYTELSGALTDATGKGGIVYLVADSKLEAAIPANTTLDVAKDVSLTIGQENLPGLITSEGKIKANAGSVINVGGNEMIGNEGNIKLTNGYIDVSVANRAALKLDFVGATAEVPSEKRWTLSMDVGGEESIPMNVTFDEDTTLTVNATGTADTEQNDGFRVAKGSTLTNDGKIVVNGVMSISSAGKVEGTGTIEVKSSGVLVVNKSDSGNSVGALDNAVTNNGTFVWNGGEGTAPEGTITLASGGEVYSQSDISDKLAGNKRTLSSTEYNGTEYQYAWKYYAKSGSSSGGGGGGGGGTPTYSNTVFETTNGNVTVSPKDALEDATVTITVKPDEGYVLDTLTVKDADGKTVEVTEKSETEYTFKMPASKVTISATFTEETAEVTTPFTDVAAGEYYYDAVLWAVENGITTGMTETTFGPNEDVSRAQMVTFLWRAAGSPEATGTNPFTDVAESDYYYDAVLWAVENGVTNGTSDTSFSPNAPVSRAQSVTFQWRAAGSPEASGDSFADVADDAYYADAVLWAVENEITNGMSETSFGPDVTVSRAQAVTFLYRAAN